MTPEERKELNAELGDLLSIKIDLEVKLQEIVKRMQEILVEIHKEKNVPVTEEKR